MQFHGVGFLSFAGYCSSQHHDTELMANYPCLHWTTIHRLPPILIPPTNFTIHSFVTKPSTNLMLAKNQQIRSFFPGVKYKSTRNL